MLPRSKSIGSAIYKDTRAGLSRGRVGMRGSASARHGAAKAARDAEYIRLGKNPVRIGMAMGAIGASTAMRPNANQSRTSYRGPMQTGRGVGRYA